MVDNLVGEEWRKINRSTKYPYFVSNKGRIKALSEQSGSEVLIGVYGDKTPHVVNICYSNGLSKSTNLSTLMAEAFIPGFDATLHSVKRIDKNKPWVLDNMCKIDGRRGRPSNSADNRGACKSVVSSGKAIPGTSGLYKIFPDGKVISTPHNKEIPAIESDYRHFVQLDIPSRGTQYVEVDKIVEELFGQSVASQLPWAKQKKAEPTPQVKQPTLHDVKQKKVLMPKSSKGSRPGRTMSVLISSPSLGKNVMDVEDAAKFLGLSARELNNRLYNWLRAEFTVDGEKVIAEYPDMVGKESYVNHNGRKLTCGKICNVATGRSYDDFDDFAKAHEKSIHRNTLVHHLGRWGAVTVGDDTFKLESLINAEAVPLRTKSRDKEIETPAIVEETQVEQEQDNEKPTNFTVMLQNTFAELSKKAQTEQEFLTLSEMAKVVAQAIKH